MFVLMISRSSSKLGHLGSKTRSPGKICGKPYHSRGHMFEAVIMNLAQNVCLDDFKSSSKLDHLGSKTRSSGQISPNLVNTLAVTFLKQST